MVVVDLNVLLYAVNSASTRHREALAWLDRALSGDATVGFTWLVMIGFLRLATHPSVLPRPMTTEQAVSVLRAWTGARPAIVVDPSVRHLDVVAALVENTGGRGNLASDAHLAGLALERGAALCTFDRDFQRFAGLEVIVPERA